MAGDASGSERTEFQRSMVPLLGPFHTMNAASSVPPPPTMATGPFLSVSSVAVMMYAPDRLSLPRPDTTGRSQLGSMGR